MERLEEEPIYLGVLSTVWLLGERAGLIWLGREEKEVGRES
jgi:hypothetical protein